MLRIGQLWIVGLSATAFVNVPSMVLGENPTHSVEETPGEVKFVVKNVVVTVKLPKDQPILTGDAKVDKEIIRKLPRLKCRIEFELAPAEGPLDQHAMGITISANHGARHLVFASGPGELKKTKDGKFVADAELFQNRPLSVASKATMALRVLRYVHGEEKPIEVDTKAGMIIIKYEDD